MPGLPPGRIPAHNPQLPKVQEVAMLIKPTAVVLALLASLTIPIEIIGGAGGSETLEVSVLYRERIMLPPGSSITVTLSDVSKMDVKAVEISSVSQQITTGPPYLLTLSYDPDSIIANHRYSLKARIENGGTLLFISTAAIDPFSAAEQPIEIVTRKVAAQAGAPATAALMNTRWHLRSAGSTDIMVKEGSEQPYFQLLESQQQVQGFGGCNNFRGSFTREKNSLAFSQVAATMKMCQENMEQEQLFFSILGSAASFEITGQKLHLFDSDKKLVGLFEAVNPE